MVGSNFSKIRHQRVMARSRRDPLDKVASSSASSSGRTVVLVLLTILIGIIICEAVVLLTTPPPAKERLRSQLASSGSLNQVKPDRPLIVLYQGKSKNHDFVWNTGYWCGWGTESKNLVDEPVLKTLPWAAEGVWVNKRCDVSCYVTDSPGLIPLADAVVMEAINQQRSFGDQPMDWPKKKKNQLWGNFYFEPTSPYEKFLNPIQDKFDFTLTPQQNSTLPVTLICPWGRAAKDYLATPPSKAGSICDFSGSNKFQNIFSEFRKTMTVDTFAGSWKNQDAPEPFSLPTRMQHVGQYKFAIIVEHHIENDWVGPEFSQALLAGTVPIYAGAPNIQEFAPGPKSFINVADFESGSELATYVQSLLDNEEEYRSYFDWKRNGLSPTFVTHLNNCAHYAECRICRHVLEQQKEEN